MKRFNVILKGNPLTNNEMEIINGGLLSNLNEAVGCSCSGGDTADIFGWCKDNSNNATGCKCAGFGNNENNYAYCKCNITAFETQQP